MTRHLLTRSIGVCAAILLLAGCTSNRSQLEPSLLSKLQGKPDVQQAAQYQTASDDHLGTKKIKDPLMLKLQYARLMEQFENYSDARVNYSEVLSEQPENFEAMIGLARVDQAVGNHERAAEGFRNALLLRPDSAIAQHALGQFEMSQGRIAEALPLLNKAVLAQPNDTAFRFDLAVALAKSGDINAAIPHFKRSVGEAAAHHNIATVLRDQGDFRGAEQHFRQALSIAPEQEESKRALLAMYRRRDESRTSGQGASGSVVQSTPNQSVIQASHETVSSPQSSLTPAQLEQQRNQQSLTR